MAFALPAALKLVNIIQIQFFTQQEQAGQHMLGYRQSVCAGGIGKHCRFRQPARNAVTFRPCIIQLDPLEMFCILQLIRVFQITEDNLRFF